MKNLSRILATLLMLATICTKGVAVSGTCRQLRTHNGRSIKAFIGFVDLIEGAEDLLKDDTVDPILAVQRLMEGVSSLIEASIHDLPISIDEQLHIAKMVDDFKKEIYNLVKNYQHKLSPDSEVERRKLIEGLAIILYNAVYILIDPKSIGSCITNILGGIYKVVSAILSDGKIDRNDWTQLLRALASIFSLSHMRQAEVVAAVAA